MSTAANLSKPADVSGFVYRVIRPLTRVFNPFILRVAGGRWFPMFSMLQHRGHKSGRIYSTPVTAVPHGGFFWLGLAFGQDSGWARNVLAAGEASMRYRATDYHLVEPMVLEGIPRDLPLVVRVGSSVMGAHKVLRMRPVTNSRLPAAEGS